MRPDSEHRAGDRDRTRAPARARRRPRARTRARAAGLLAAALVGGLLVTGCAAWERRLLVGRQQGAAHGPAARARPGPPVRTRADRAGHRGRRRAARHRADRHPVADARGLPLHVRPGRRHRVLRLRPPHPRRRAPARPEDRAARGVHQQLPPGLPASRGRRLLRDGRRGPRRMRRAGPSFASASPPARRPRRPSARPPRSPSSSTSPAPWPNPAGSTWSSSPSAS